MRPVLSAGKCSRLSRNWLGLASKILLVKKWREISNQLLHSRGTLQTVILCSTGDLTLDLTRMPRGAKSAKTCTLDLLKQDGSVPQISFFKIKHIKGFWPFTVNTDEEVPELAVSSESVILVV